MLRRARRFVGNPLGRSRAAFLVGCGRSGTNLVTRRLSRSWEVELINEDDPRAFDDWRLRDESTIERLVAASPARVALFKPILDTPRSPGLLARFEDARVIFAFRHYQDVINSSITHFGEANWSARVRGWVERDFDEFEPDDIPQATRERVLARWDTGLDAPSAIALYWLFYNGLYFDQGLVTDPRVLPLHYESTVREPERAFRALCTFLGIGYRPQLAEDVYTSSIGRGRPSALDPAVESDCQALWHELTTHAQRRIDRIDAPSRRRETTHGQG